AFDKIKNVCAVDVAYDAKKAYCSAVVMSRVGEHLESVSSVSEIKYPYVPGFLMLREGPPIFRTLKKLKNDYDLILVDGHGQLHPRRCGIACYVGVKLDKPTIGIAKSLLCGTVSDDGSIALGGQILGKVIGTGRKKLYVSVGHRVSLATAVALVTELGKGNNPEVMKQADALSKYKKRERVG
ncbi:MAG TPA: endonuclease V, partial [Nitrososphaera sp.]|nr:endonuclease V [Nitrososphaera sp.]